MNRFALKRNLAIINFTTPDKFNQMKSEFWNIGRITKATLNNNQRADDQ